MSSFLLYHYLNPIICISYKFIDLPKPTTQPRPPFTMKLVTLFTFMSTAAAVYKAGTPCYTNVECNQNCIDKKWTIQNIDSDYVLVCDPKGVDPVLYHYAQCRTVADPYGVTPDLESTRKTCAAVGGKFCNKDAICSFNGKRSAETASRQKWNTSCKSNLSAAGRDSAGSLFESSVSEENTTCTR